MLTVRECVPFLTISNRRPRPLRATQVVSANQALSLSWIRALPGEKRVQFFRGQVFVIQRYQGVQLIRAHISHAQERPSESPAGSVSSCEGLASMAFPVNPAITSQA
jgi:hypothetical protein